MEGLEVTLTTVFTIARVSIYTALAAGLALTVFVLLNELISYSKLGYYKKQVVKTYYFPVIGLLKLAKPLLFKKNKEESPISESEDLIAGNHFMSTEPHLLITSPKLLSEYFLQETSHFTRISSATSNDDSESFFFDYTENGHKMRGLFVDFFRMENINKIVPDIAEVFEKKFDKFIEDNWGKEGERDPKSIKEWKTLDLEHTISEAFDEMVNVVFFGETDKDAIPTIDGKMYSVFIQELSLKGIAAMKKPFNILTKHFFYFNKLNKDGREIQKMILKTQEEMGKFYKKRLSSSQKRGLGTNLMDILIKKDQEMINAGKPDQVFTPKTIANTTRAFYIAGYDTSKSNSSIGLCWLSRNPEVQSKLRDAFKTLDQAQNGGSIDLNSSEYVNEFTMENLRRFGPAYKTIPRLCLKTCKLGKYTIRKGTTLQIDLQRIHSNPESFKDPFEFKSERFEDLTKAKGLRRKNKFIPFLAGRRSCIGQYLGECVVKIVLKTVLDRFELGIPEDRKGKDLGLNVRFTLEAEDVKLNLRLLK